MSYQKQKKALGKLRKMLFILPKGSFCCRDIYFLYYSLPCLPACLLCTTAKRTEAD